MGEIYIVAARRKDGTFPKACKAQNDRIFHSLEDALHFIDDLGKVGYDPAIFSVYKAFLEVKELVY